MKLSLLYEALPQRETKTPGDFWLCTWQFTDNPGHENKPLLFINAAGGKFVFAYVSTKNHNWHGRVDLAPSPTNGLREQSYVYLSKLKLVNQGDVHRKVGQMDKDDWNMCLKELDRLRKLGLVTIS